MRRKTDGVRLRGPIDPGVEDPLKELLELKRVCAQSDCGANDLKNAVEAMDQVSKKLLDAIGHLKALSLWGSPQCLSQNCSICTLR